MILFRPVGLEEYRLIEGSGFAAFPPRLPEQPIFYPVLTWEYAHEIALKWNTRSADAGYRGFVTRFAVDDAFVCRYPVHTVGVSYHQELWVPAEELAEFNRHIVGTIEIVETLPKEGSEKDGLD